MTVSITATGAAPAGVVGPAWADTSGRTEVVRNPLRVQDHVVRKVGDYVPGLTAVTPHARYYSLHPWVIAHAVDAGLDDTATADLLRRAEVAVAWASSHHQSHLADLPVAHGRDALARHISGGTLNLRVASRQGQYSPRRLGFLESAYSNPENIIGVMAAGPRPGLRFDAKAQAAAGGNLGWLLETARADELTEADGRDGAAAGWCVCSARLGDEGVWLRELFTANLPGPTAMRAEDKTRRHTLELLARSIAHQPAASAPAPGVPESAADDFGADPEDLLRQSLLFSGPLEESPAAEGLVEFAEHWRGLLLRHYTVTAWRRLWAAIVNTVEGGEGRRGVEIGALIAAGCPDTSVGAFAARFETQQDGRLLPAEEQAWADDAGPAGDIGVLVISARRTGEVGPTARAVLTGNDRNELGPGWLANQVANESGRPLREWVAAVCELLLVRAQRIGLSKFRVSPVDGRAIVPAQVSERDGIWRKVYEVGTTPLGLRIASLATIAAGAGLLDHHDGAWSVTAEGVAAGIA